MKNVKNLLVMVLFALISSTAIAQTNGAKNEIDIDEFDRLQKYISLNVANIQNWSNIAISLLEELEDDDLSPLHDNPYYWEFVYKEFKSCLDKASHDLAIYNKVPPTNEEIKDVVARYEDKILAGGYEGLNLFLRYAKLNNYITSM